LKTALITGANRGIGLEVARQLGQRGFLVWLGARNEKAGKIASASLREAGMNVKFVVLDVSLKKSIDAARKIISTQNQRLDVLVNNAGILLDEYSPIVDVSEQTVHETFNINALGPLFVTQAFAPLLGKGSRVVNVSSGAGEIGRGMSRYAPVYSISKTTLNAVTCQFAHELKSRGVAVNAVDPGWVRTDMGTSAAPRSVERGADTIVWLSTEAPISETGKFWRDRKQIPW
jgi:NAD(P)-dependent dehydrogenase (short-subunit alcohol dehydrogenase family)